MRHVPFSEDSVYNSATDRKATVTVGLEHISKKEASASGDTGPAALIVAVEERNSTELQK